MTQQGFNQGMILAIRSDGRPGGHVDIEHIDGIQHSVGRAVPIPGSTLRSQPLRINDDQESLLSYPFRITLNMLGFSVFKFKWDATGIPLATAGQGSKAMFTAMRYRANVPGSSRPDLSNQTGKLYWYSNLADLRSLTDHARRSEHTDQRHTKRNRSSNAFNPGRIRRHQFGGQAFTRRDNRPQLRT